MKRQASGSISLVPLFLLFLLFLGLKLTGHIAWSWWWVTAPLWVVPAGLGALFAVVFAFTLIKNALTSPWARR